MRQDPGVFTVSPVRQDGVHQVAHVGEDHSESSICGDHEIPCPEEVRVLLCMHT